jgi:hypothetical protein
MPILPFCLHPHTWPLSSQLRSLLKLYTAVPTNSLFRKFVLSPTCARVGFVDGTSNLIYGLLDDLEWVLSSTCSNLIDFMLDPRQLETKWRGSELLYGEVGNLHDFFHICPQIMHFSYFSAMEVLVSNHPPLPVELSFYRFCQSGALHMPGYVF